MAPIEIWPSRTQAPYRHGRSDPDCRHAGRTGSLTSRARRHRSDRVGATIRSASAPRERGFRGPAPKASPGTECAAHARNRRSEIPADVRRNSAGIPPRSVPASQPHVQATLRSPVRLLPHQSIAASSRPTATARCLSNSRAAASSLVASGPTSPRRHSLRRS